MSNTRVGRNDPCPCGSRKKFKHCCLRLGNSNGAPQPMPVYGEAPAFRRASPSQANRQRARAEPPSLGVRVEYTIQDTLGKAEVTYRYPFGLPVILANGYVIRVEQLTPGMEFLIEGGGVATVTKVDRPKLREPSSPEVDADGNSLKHVVGTFKYTGWVPLLEVTYGGAVHKITPGHGYLSESRRGWYPIATFQRGEWLRTEENEVIPVEDLAGPRWEQTSVYNVEVEDFHTYFAGNGDKAAWSHNGGADGCGVPKAATTEEGRSMTRAIRDEVKTRRSHTIEGSEVKRQLRKGQGAHVFDEGVDLRAIEQKVFTEGTFSGSVGTGQRAGWDRFVWESPTPIGRRIQTGKPDLPLNWVEVKGHMVGNDWVYHLVPRPRPAS